MVGTSLAACSGIDAGTTEEQAGNHFGYQVPVELSTTNAGTEVGASEFAQMLSGRLYPGVFVPGPSGQVIPNTDLVRAQALPGAQRIVEYSLSAEASFSDGAPVTCTDYLLAYTAGKNPELFGSHMPLFQDVERLDCTPGAKNFDLVFAEGQGARWRDLFGAGTVLPAHAVAGKLGKDEAALNADLTSGSVDVLRPIAEVWREGFNLAQFDPEMQVSFGPYKIADVGEAGQVTLTANENYYGDAPLTKEIVVWPGSADSAELRNQDNLRIADLDEPDPDWLDVDAEGNALDVTTTVGSLTDSLTFESFGPWSYYERRQALAKCVDPRAVAAASSGASGVEVPATSVHLVSHNDPLARRFDDIVAPRMDVDVEGAKAAAGLELRVGYVHPSKRMAAMVESIRASCEPAGITVVDVTKSTGEGKTLRDLSRIEKGEWGEDAGVEGEIDAMLRPVNPQTEYSAPGSRAQDLDAMRKKEAELWTTLPSIPLAAQPRSFAVDRNLANVIVYTGPTGIGWNMDRWQLRPESADKTAEPTN
ncbi:peptide ABC transporter [Corynebacterium qintianiae]|uniref:Peptide ABC transporter n=1 Tax=Corynebacterium qintianiae TaxID=2709392 RepID=A0A7T0KP48_9CORY|nr:peptide ABC transporter [Corynebacterium qintianiae]